MHVLMTCSYQSFSRTKTCGMCCAGDCFGSILFYVKDLFLITKICMWVPGGRVEMLSQ